MNTTELTIVAHHRPEVLERILRVIRHRGYCVCALNMKLENQKVWLDVQIHSDRAPELLVPQLQKLIDVVDVTVDSGE